MSPDNFVWEPGGGLDDLPKSVTFGGIRIWVATFRNVARRVWECVGVGWGSVADFHLKCRRIRMSPACRHLKCVIAERLHFKMTPRQNVVTSNVAIPESRHVRMSLLESSHLSVSPPQNVATSEYRHLKVSPPHYHIVTQSHRRLKSATTWPSIYAKKNQLVL